MGDEAAWSDIAAHTIKQYGALLAGTQRPVYQLGSSDLNPLSMIRLVELCGLYKRKHYQRKNKGNPFLNFISARIESVPVSTDEYFQHGAPAIATPSSASFTVPGPPSSPQVSGSIND